MIAYVAYFVLRQLRIKEWLSTGGALVYAFLPFIFIRGIGHIVLSCYYFVPLAVLVIISGCMKMNALCCRARAF